VIATRLGVPTFLKLSIDSPDIFTSNGRNKISRSGCDRKLWPFYDFLVSFYENVTKFFWPQFCPNYIQIRSWTNFGHKEKNGAATIAVARCHVQNFWGLPFFYTKFFYTKFFFYINFFYTIFCSFLHHFLLFFTPIFFQKIFF